MASELFKVLISPVERPCSLYYISFEIQIIYYYFKSEQFTETTYG